MRRLHATHWHQFEVKDKFFHSNKRCFKQERVVIYDLGNDTCLEPDRTIYLRLGNSYLVVLMSRCAPVVRSGIIAEYACYIARFIDLDVLLLRLEQDDLLSRVISRCLLKGLTSNCLKVICHG